MSMRYTLYATLTVAALTLTSGCAPYPHRFYSRPDIQGTLSAAAVPVRNAEVLIGVSSLSREPCKDAASVGVTNERGEFAVAGLDRVEIMYSFLNPPEVVGQLTSVCFRSTGEPVLFGAQFITHTNKPSHLKIVCDPAMPTQRSPLGVPQICR